jgi:transcriptional regulator with XRE-family HTH domain
MKTEGDIAAIRYNLGNRIRLIRDEQNLTQNAFSEMVQINRSYLVDVEHGKRNVSIDNLIKIAKGLGMTLSELFEGVDTTVLDKRMLLTQQLLDEERKRERP